MSNFSTGSQTPETNIDIWKASPALPMTNNDNPAFQRFLLIWRDDIFENEPGLECDFIPTGKTYIPGYNCNDTGKRTSLLRVIARLTSGKYDAIILPAVHFGWHADPRRSFKLLLRRLIANDFILKRCIPPIMQKFCGSATILLLDRIDSVQTSSRFAAAVGADIYFKTNLSESEIAAIPCKASVLPYWINEHFYPTATAPKSIDLFYSAAPNSLTRRKAAAELDALREAGVHVFSPTERIPFETFVTTLAQSLLTLSPEGHGYHGFRHYEAMLMQSVPVINRPPPQLRTSLRPGEHCLFYDPDKPGDLMQIVLKALEDRAALETWGARLRGYALEHHTFAAIAKLLRKQIAEIKETKQKG